MRRKILQTQSIFDDHIRSFHGDDVEIIPDDIEYRLLYDQADNKYVHRFYEFAEPTEQLFGGNLLGASFAKFIFPEMVLVPRRYFDQNSQMLIVQKETGTMRLLRKMLSRDAVFIDGPTLVCVGTPDANDEMIIRTSFDVLK